MNVNRIAAVAWTTIAEGDMIDGSTIGIRSANESFANISTLGTVSILYALSTGRTIGIRLALECQATAFIVRIADVSGATSAMECAFVVGADGTRAAWCVTTEIDRRTLCVRITAEAGLTVANGMMIFGCAQSLFAARFARLARQFA